MKDEQVKTVSISVSLSDLQKIMDACERIKKPSVPYLTSQLSMANFAIDLAGKEASAIQVIIDAYGIDEYEVK